MTISDEASAPFVCLSAPGKPFALPEEARKILCYTNHGHLYVLKGNELGAWSLAYQEFLRRQRQNFKLLSKNSNEIENRYIKGGMSLKRSAKNREHQSSIVQLEVIKLVKEAVEARASDLHIILQSNRALIRFRVDGVLATFNEMSAEDGTEMCATIYQTMCDVAEPVFNPHRSQDARLNLGSVAGLKLYEGRIATRPTDDGLLMVIRLLYERMESGSSLETLGYLEAQVQDINRISGNRFGINILSGPTGSGKSTTLEHVLKSMIRKSQGSSHVLTIEDPPEYRIPGAVQTPILCDKDDDQSISQEWARSIANAMRLDPDTLMCGEIRDQASATATFRAAMTGHVVWTTLHANDALSILTRLEDIGISKTLLLDATLVTGLINQVLVKKLCTQCKLPYSDGARLIEPQQKYRIESSCDIEKVFLKGAGCKACKDKGIMGRTVVAECMVPNFELLDLYGKKGKASARDYWIQEMKGLTKQRVLIQKINEGLIDPRDGENDVGWLSV